MKIIFSIVTKKRRNLNADNVSFSSQQEKLKIDNENEIVSEKVIGDDEIVIVNVVSSLVIGKHHV